MLCKNCLQRSVAVHSKRGPWGLEDVKCVNLISFFSWYQINVIRKEMYVYAVL